MSASFLIRREPWMKDAACKYAPKNLFILDRSVTAAKAKKYCEICPVVSECFSYAVRTNSVGVWGGQLFTNSSGIPEIYPIRPVEAMRVEPVREEDRVRRPSILGRKSERRGKDSDLEETG